MARLGLRARLRRLENARKDAGLSRIAVYAPATGLYVGNARLAACVMRVPDWGTDAEWEAAAMKQQAALMSEVENTSSNGKPSR